MDKKRFFGIIFSLSLIFSLFLISAQSASDASNSTQPQISTDQSKINNAYQCLENKVSGKCNSISTSEKIFSALSTGACVTELIDSSKDKKGECWTSSSGTCDLKMTAQAVMALVQNGKDASLAINWMRSQNQTPSFDGWQLQVDSNSQADCSVSYGDTEFTFTLNEDKSISSSSSSNCIFVSSDGYSLQVKSEQSCLNNEYIISCNSPFTTSLVYKSDSVYYIPSRSNSASADGQTTEKINAKCLKDSSGTCDYEGTLWASLALSQSSQDIGEYLPYLQTYAESPDYEKYFPSAFLYFLSPSGDTKIYYENLLLSKARTSGTDKAYWNPSNADENKFKETALALLVTQYRDFGERDKAINWLLGSQDSSGCWQNGRIDTTGFVLYSISDRFSGGIGGLNIPTDETPSTDCTSAGGYCLSQIECESVGGDVLSDYSGTCSGLSVCCSAAPQSTQTCIEQGGTICAPGESCVGLSSVEKEASDLLPGETCCAGIDASCEESLNGSIGGETGQAQESSCSDNFGTCKSSCDSGETSISTFSCPNEGDVCCIQSEGTSKGGSLLWLWIVLGVLIVLLVLGIIFRDRIKLYMMKFSSKGGPSAPSSKGPFGPRFPPRGVPPSRRPIGGRRIVPSQFPPQKGVRPAPPKVQGEVNDVLKKLKEMSK